MKALTLTTVCLLATSTYAQDIVPAQQQQQAPVVQAVPQQNQAVAPAVFYAPASGDKTVTPQTIEVEVPVYAPFQAKVQVQKIYTEIKGSQFFFEVKPVRLKGHSTDFESNLITINNNPELELEMSSFKAKLMPLDFKFGFENEGWGSFAEVSIEDGEDSSEVAVYAKLGVAKIGGGFALDITDDEMKGKRNSVVVAKDTIDTMEIAAYFYTAFQLVNDESLLIEQSNKIGGSYMKADDGGLKIKGLSFDFNPALDIMFKINPKLQIGTGIEFEYSRFSGDLEASGNTFGGVGNTFGFELNLIKTKFLF